MEATGPAVRARGLGMTTVEIATSLLIIAVGAVAIWDSLRVGAGWGTDGPQTGYFPFWIGLIMIGASAGNLVQVARARRNSGEAPLFASWSQLRTVMTVLLPTTAYVAAIPFAGIYLASALLVAWFMARLGGYRWWRSVAAGLAAALITFFVFETQFLVALPKGPIEAALGF